MSLICLFVCLDFFHLSSSLYNICRGRGRRVIMMDSSSSSSDADGGIYSLESTPAWAVAAVCSVLIALALLIEHALHLLPLLFERRKRKTLNQALYHIESELRKLGFMSLLLTVAKNPISKICIPRSLAEQLLPCKKINLPVDEIQSCRDKGKVSLISTESTEQVQTLIFVLAVFHVISCLMTFLLGDAKMNRWKSWEEHTHTTDFQLSYDPRRFVMARKTSFGKRHLNLWSDNPLFLWLVCSFRQFVSPVSKDDYYILRHGFLKVHFNNAVKFDFHKFIMRSLDHDFVVVVRISLWIWIYAMFFIVFTALEFHNRYWPCFIPLVILSVVGTKLEVIITTMCLKSSQGVVVVPGTVSVTPDNNLFWFNKPEFLLHIIQFILVQNSFHLAFIIWSWYNFGLRSCFHTQVDDIILTIMVGLLVEFLCAYVTLPLYALVTQMGSSMKTSIFSDHIIEGLKNWHKTAKKNLEEKKSVISLSRSSTIGSTSMTSEERSPSNTSKCNLEYPSASLSRKLAGSASTWGSRIVQKVKHPSGKLEASTTTTCMTIEEEASAASITRMPIQEFNFPSGSWNF
ncbi:MLO-like protein 9 isoform X1 [Iris pallida]|uniref:MLO-like protein n=1 Tax=Iris pallida TaxID=29817 RepID=A0AAX6DJX0_IRIPA|nr:MLO-like protein 9 isoform X1 [Iris pallida]